MRLTPAQIKAAYESNADTNALTDARLALLVQRARFTIAAARTRTLGSNPLRLGPQVPAAGLLHVLMLRLEKPAGAAGTGAGNNNAPVFWSADGANPRAGVADNNRFFNAAAAVRYVVPRVIQSGQSLWLGSSGSRGNNLADRASLDQDVEVTMLYVLSSIGA